MIDVPFSEDLLDQVAMSTAGGKIAWPDNRKKPPVFRFPSMDSYRYFDALRTQLKKSTVEGRS